MAISGYADFVSVRPGGTINLYVSTDAPRFRTELYRVGAAMGPPLSVSPQRDVRVGVNRPIGKPNADWGWQAYPYEIPPTWTSGVYVCMFVECDQGGTDLPGQPLDRSTYDGPDRKAMFTVRPAPGAARRVLFKLPAATYAAYNWTGGGSSYANGGLVTSLRRPGLGTGGVTTYARAGTPYHQVDWYSPGTDRATLAHLEAPFIAWLEKSGYQLDYCNDFDFEVDPALLDPYQLLLSVGHDEYWSDAQRNLTTAFLKRGGNVAFFSGNTCYKFIKFPEPWLMANKGTWTQNGRPPEDSFTGVSYTHGGGRWDSSGRWDGPRQVVGYTLQFQDHWALRDVASPLGAVYPDTGEPSGCVGYECDGARSTLQNGVRVPIGAPGDFMILGHAQLDPSWQDEMDKTRACTIGLYTSPGIALTVGTTDWPRVAASGRDPSVAAFTRNVLDALSVPQPGWTALGGQITSTPLLARNADGRLEVLGRGYDGAARHCWQVAVNGGFSGWAARGGSLAGTGYLPTRMASARNADGRLAVSGRFADGTVQVLSQTAPNSGWGTWVSLAGSVGGDPVLAQNLDGRLAVFVRGYDGIAYYQQQVAPGAAFGGWIGVPENAGFRVNGNFDVARNADGRLQLFARGGDHAIWSLVQAAPNGAMGNWTSLEGDFPGEPVAGANADGRLEVFARGADGKLYHAWQKTPGGPFSGFKARGGALASNPAVARNADGRLEVIARGTDGAIWHIAQVAPNGTWGSWASLGGTFAGDPAIGTHADGRLGAFAVGPARNVWHRAQSKPGAW